MKVFALIALLAGTTLALPGHGPQTSAAWTSNAWGGGGHETCSLVYVTSTSVGYKPTTYYSAKTTYVPITTVTPSQVIATKVVTTVKVKTITTQVPVVVTSWVEKLYTTECTESYTTSCTEETHVPVTYSTAVVTTCPVVTSVPYTTSSIETETVCCTKDEAGHQGPWYTKSHW